MLRLTVSEIFVVKCQKLVSQGPKMIHSKPFFEPCIWENLKVSPTKEENKLPETWLNHSAKIRTITKISVPRQKTELQQMIYPIKHIIALRLQDNKISSKQADNLIPENLNNSRKSRRTGQPGFRLCILVLANPLFIPSMSKVNDENQLDEYEQERSNHSNHHPR